MNPELMKDVEMSAADFETAYRQAEEARFLEFADLVQIGVRAIRETRVLRSKLERAEEEADKWRKIATEASGAAFRQTLDLVTAMSEGALTTSDDPSRRAAALRAMGER